MKRKILWIIGSFPMIAAALSVKFLPDKIPLHYDLHGVADRYGSKYELFLMAVILLIILVIFQIAIKYFDKKQLTSENEKSAIEAYSNSLVTYTIAVTATIFENIMTIMMIYNAFKISDRMSDGFITLIAALISVLFIIIGNIMPKSRNNSIVGLRTKWSMYNDITWAKSNRFAGTAFTVGGFISLISAFIFHNMLCTCIIIFVITFISIIYSYKVYKNQIKENTYE